MKKTLFVFALATIAFTISCQKEDNNYRKDELVFTANIIDSQTKTTINTDRTSPDKGKIYWVKGDEITITDASSNSSIYVAMSDGQSTEFKKKIGQLDLGAGPYSATYGTAPSAIQNYEDYYYETNAAKNLYMTAPSSNTKSLTFSAACGLLMLNLTASSVESAKDICKIEIMGSLSDGSETTYTLNCSTAQGISSEKEFYIAIPAGSYYMMKFTNSTGHVCFKTAKTEMVMINNTIQPTSISNIVFNDILPGKFTIAFGKLVRFSKGNLQATYSGSSYSWNFADNQFDIIGNNAGNTSIGSQIIGKKVDLFGWSNNSTNYGINTSTSSSYSGSFVDWGSTIKGSIWRTLSSDEWNYLLYSRNCSTISSKANARYVKVILNGVKGLILFPDNFTLPSGVNIPASNINQSSPNFSEVQIDINSWQKLEKHGCVFLPAGEQRYGTSVTNNGSCTYWSSSKVQDMALTIMLNIGSGFVRTDSSQRCYGRSVRLVCDTQ